jgi:hypothetical protein
MREAGGNKMKTCINCKNLKYEKYEVTCKAINKVITDTYRFERACATKKEKEQGK